MAVVAGGNLAYVTTRSTANETDVEFGVHAFGADAEKLAEEVAEQLRIWERGHRTGPARSSASTRRARRTTSCQKDVSSTPAPMPLSLR
jgi:hypothetical protein